MLRFIPIFSGTLLLPVLFLSGLDAPFNNAQYTEFYVLDAGGGISSGLSYDSRSFETDMIVGITSREAKPAAYRIEAWHAGSLLVQYTTDYVNYGESRELTASVSLRQSAAELDAFPNLDLLLYRVGDRNPYRQLRLRMQDERHE